ncbi:nucleotidyltransferase domain-containing protein [Bacillus sp. HMF5848]|uniref:type VII toxin-antitoxin system MntA family adenylyltransferase antitoxin n=1 Tax=Bacillus sp. HMF5848 TaxID=2495421 RepID=UPI000F7A79AE|nr:nucleotidyltransferase domain-containing protein [Bacillus sp. HMF5848]RSK27651.1 nucleotidyltransferase domain-containing protein [Bacillus sp. HMF5848]
MDSKIEQIIMQHLIGKLSPTLIYVFGSTIKGTSRAQSDIDIAFLGNNMYDSYQLFIIGQELASKLGQEVDLIDLQKSSTVFQAQIVTTGKIIYCTDVNKKAQFEMKTLKMYAKLNEERAPVLESIEESGTIYEK